MKRKLRTGILVVLGMAVIVFQPIICGIIAIGIWIYLVRVIWKHNHNKLNEQMASQISNVNLTRLKVFLRVAAFSFLVFIVGAIVHNVLHGINDTEEPVFFIISLVALVVFAMATAIALVVFRKGRQKAI